MLNCVTTVPKRVSILCESNQRSSRQGSFFSGRRLFAEELLREHPALVGMKSFAADECDGAFLVVLADAFADAAAADAAADDEIVALNHLRKSDDRECDNGMAREKLVEGTWIDKS